MKKFVQCVSLVLILAMCLAIPAYATESATPWASNYFISSSAYLWKTSSTSFQVWFDVRSAGGMTELGASVIKVQYRPSTSDDWETVQTYTKEAYSNMICSNTSAHASYVTYNKASEHGYYRAYVEFYAKNSSGGRGYYDYYTASIYM